jgi:hypothetical protein
MTTIWHKYRSIEIINISLGSTAGTTSSGHTGHATGSATSLLVDAHHDGVEFTFKFLLLHLEVFLGSLGGVGNVLETVSGSFLNGLLVSVSEFGGELLFSELVLHLEAVVLKTVLGFNLALEFLVLRLEFLGFVNHLLDLFLGETTLIVGDSDLFSLTGGLVHGVDVKDTIGINIESDLNLGNTTGAGGDTAEIEFTEQVVVLGHATFTFEHLNEDTGLVVSVGGESLGLLGGDSGVASNKHGHDTTGGLDTHGEGSDIEEEEVLDLLGTFTGEDSSLDGGAIGDGLVRVDGAVQGLAVEEVGEHGLDLGDTGGATDEDDFVDLALAEVSILKDVLNWGHALAEKVNAKLLEFSAGDGAVVVLTLAKSFALNFGLMGSGKNTLGLLALGTETAGSTGITLDVNAGLLLEVSHAEFDETVVEVLTTKMGVTISGLDLEDTFLNGEEGDIESTTSEIEDENVAFTFTLLVETVGNSGSGGLVDNTLDIETSNGTSILGSLTLGIVEVSGDSDDSLLDSLTEVSLSDFAHLDENHGGDLLSLELLGLTLKLDRDLGLVGGTGLNSEGPELAIVLDDLVSELAANEALGVKDGVLGVTCSLVLGGISDKTLFLSEGNVRGGGVEALIVSDDLDLVVLPDTNAGVGGAKINSDSGHVMYVV